MLVYQRVNLHFPMVFLWFSYDLYHLFLDYDHYPRPTSAQERIAPTPSSPWFGLSIVQGQLPLRLGWSTAIPRDPIDSGNHPQMAADFRYFQVGEVLSGWWFGTFFIFPYKYIYIILYYIIIICVYIYIGNNHPNWRTHIFQRGRSTTNQLWFSQIHYPSSEW